MKAWVLACRPKTLPVAIAPVLLGVAVALQTKPFFSARDFGVLFLCLLGALLLQIESNLVNDYFDWKKGSDTAERLGPPRATSSGWIRPSEMRVGIVIVAGLSLAVGALLASLVGPVIVAIGIASLISAFLYTAGPFPLSRLGIADLFVFTFFGPVAVMGTVYALNGFWDPLALFLSVPLGAVAVCVLLVNNIRDIEEDTKSGKRTSVVRMGLHRAICLYQILLTMPIVAGLALAMSRPSFLLTLFVLPLTWTLWRGLPRLRGRELNPFLAKTGAYLFLSAVALSLGLVL